LRPKTSTKGFGGHDPVQHFSAQHNNYAQHVSAQASDRQKVAARIQRLERMPNKTRIRQIIFSLSVLLKGGHKS